MENIKKLFLFILMSCSVNIQLNAQNYKHQLSFSPVTRNYQGWSIDANIKFVKPRSTFYFGPSILLNPPKYAMNYNATYENKAYASNFIQRVMLKAGYEHSFGFNSNSVRFFSFGELHFSRTDLKLEAYQGKISPSLYDNDSAVVVIEHNYVDPYAKNILFFNLNLGLGFEMRITKRISFQERLAVTQNFTYYKEEINGISPLKTSISFFHSLGLNYSF